MPPVVQAYTEEFCQEFPWFRGNSWEDQAKTSSVEAIDRAVYAEGFRPHQQEYWDEIRDRMRALNLAPEPRRATTRNEQDTRVQPEQRQPEARRAPAERRGPMMGGSADARPSGNSTAVYLSPERKEALISVGALDRDGRTVTDPTKFKRICAQYVAFDRQNGTGR